MKTPTLPDDLLAVLATMDTTEDVHALLRDILTPAELIAVAERWNIVKMIAAGHSQREIRDGLGVGIATVTRGSRQLQYSEFGGFAKAFDAMVELGRPDPRDGAHQRAQLRRSGGRPTSGVMIVDREEER